MLRESQTEVLVVGAGPVGMLTTLALAQQGVRVEVIDTEERTDAQSHACALHPETFRLLAQMDMADELLAVGHRVDRIAFYEGDSRCAELHFSEIRGGSPFLLVVPQNEFEDLLERKLAEHAATRIQWSHRLADLQPRDEKVLAIIDKLCEIAKGYPIVTWQHAVEKSIRTQAAFVVGADGRDSHVRQLLKIEHDTAAAMECFAVFEFESDAQFRNEARIVLHDGTTDVLWPLPGKRWQWTFQIASQEVPDDAHVKNRLYSRFVDPVANKEFLREMHQLVEERAPWFDAPADKLDWCTVIDFEPRVAKQYGLGRCWLAGDAAHLSSPIGMQSMNVGLREGVELAHIMADILRRERPLESLTEYASRYRNEWQQLLGLETGIRSTPDAVPWAHRRSAQILPCVPASGDDLVQLLGQVGLTLQKLGAQSMPEIVH